MRKMEGEEMTTVYIHKFKNLGLEGDETLAAKDLSCRRFCSQKKFFNA